MLCFGGSGNIMDDLHETNEQINKHKDVKQICSIWYSLKHFWYSENDIQQNLYIQNG